MYYYPSPSVRYVPMRYKLGGLDFLQITNIENREYAIISFDYGANLCSLCLQTPNNQLIEVIDGYRTPDEWATHSGYKSSKLLPFPNRIKDGNYAFRGKTYQLPINRPKENHAIHGFFYNQKSRLIQYENVDDKMIVVTEGNYNGDIPGFPFPFTTMCTYELSPHKLICRTAVSNDSPDTAMPLGDGWHPYFQLGNNTTINDCYLQLPTSQQYILDDRKLPTGETIENPHFQTLHRIGEQQLDDTFGMLNPTQSNEAHTILQAPDKTFKLVISQQIGEKAYNFLQVYTPSHRRSIAIEPMTCTPNAFNNGIGLIVLEPKQKYVAQYSVGIEV